MVTMIGKAIGYPIAVALSPIWLPVWLLFKALRLGAKAFLWAVNLWKPQHKALRFVKSSVIFITLFPVTPVAAAGVAWNEAGRPTEMTEINGILYDQFGLGVVVDWISTLFHFGWNYAMSFV